MHISLGNKKMRVALFIAALVTTSATAEPIRWTTSASGGSILDIPKFMTETWVRGLIRSGEEEPYGTVYEPEGYPIMLRQYYMVSTRRPYQYIAHVAPNDIKPTQKIDNPNLGVISGYVFDGDEIYYGMCKKADKLYCFDVYYAANKKTEYDPIVKRIAKSFKKCATQCL